MFDYFSFGKITKAINYNKDTCGYDTIIIYFEKNTITLYALADCCSVSRFVIQNNDLNYLIGKKIIHINEKKSFNDLNYKNGRLQITPISLRLDNQTEFNLALHNKSNGYYSGWMEIEEGVPLDFDGELYINSNTDE